MTPEEYKLLSPERQEIFIASGQTLVHNTLVHSVSAPECSPDIEARNGRESCEVSSSPTPDLNLPSQNALSSFNSTQSSNDFFDTKYPFNGFAIKDPVELLYTFDDNISSGRVKLYDWQIQYMLDFAVGGLSDKQPFQSLVRAANGSGKDKYIIAACATWLCMRYTWANAVITSSSGTQLDNQTCTHLETLLGAINRKLGFNVWKINYRYYECQFGEGVKSPIMCFATDEPGKAEGFHPLEFDAKFAIFESEAKTVPDEIYIAQNKCTGYTHRAIVSTPGLPMGHFHRLCSRSIYRKEIDEVKECDPTQYIQYHITAYDCPGHLSRNYIEQMKLDLPGGENSAAFKSQILAEFGTTDEMVVIPYNYIWLSLPKPGITPRVWYKEEHNKAGLDLSDGGDETVLSIRNGNKLLKVIPFRFDNTQDTIKFLEEKFRENDLDHADALIYADMGGLGKPMLDQLRARGWSNIRYVDNRNTPYYPKTYKNRGAEVWFNFRKLCERKELILIDDHTTVTQLSTRYYKITNDNKHQLLSKIESRSRGYPSPDRADSVVLAFWDYKLITTDDSDPSLKKPFEDEDKDTTLIMPFSMKRWSSSTQKDTTTYKDYYAKVSTGSSQLSSLRDEIEEYNSNRHN